MVVGFIPNMDFHDFHCNLHCNFPLHYISFYHCGGFLEALDVVKWRRVVSVLIYVSTYFHCTVVIKALTTVCCSTLRLIWNIKCVINQMYYNYLRSDTDVWLVDGLVLWTRCVFFLAGSGSAACGHLQPFLEL